MLYILGLMALAVKQGLEAIIRGEGLAEAAAAGRAGVADKVDADALLGLRCPSARTSP